MEIHFSGFLWMCRLMGSKKTHHEVFLFTSKYSEKGNDITSQESHVTELLHDNEWVYDTNVRMTKQETGVGDSERPFSSKGTAHRLVPFIWRFLMHIGQRWWRKKRSVWDRHHPIASSCCIPHTRGNIPAALHHGGKSQRQAMFIFRQAAILELLALKYCLQVWCTTG